MPTPDEKRLLKSGEETARRIMGDLLTEKKTWAEMLIVGGCLVAVSANNLGMDEERLRQFVNEIWTSAKQANPSN